MFVAYRTIDSRTPGVYVLSKAWISDELSLTIPQNHRHLAYEYGLISEYRYLTIKTRHVPLLFVPQYRTELLPPKLLPALALSISHNAKGMTAELSASAALIAGGLLLSLGAFIALGSMLLMFLLSVLTHEAGHVAAYRIITGPETPAYLVRRGIQSHLVRLPLPRRPDRAVIIAGPASPLFIAALLLPIAWVFPVPYFAWLAIALGHFVLLVAPIGDGANLRESYRRRLR
ncbi:hypothetical protein [Plantibacter sp. YIM 135347]